MIENGTCVPFSHTWPSWSHVSLADETGEAGSWNFASDGEQNIPDDKTVLEQVSRLCDKRKRSAMPSVK